MPIGPPYWIRMVYSKNGKWSAVCLIEYVWSNIFQLTAPVYVLMSMCGLFGTEEYTNYVYTYVIDHKTITIVISIRSYRENYEHTSKMNIANNRLTNLRIFYTNFSSFKKFHGRYTANFN